MEHQDAFIAKINGEKIINFKKNNLHIVNYSTAINKIINKKELLKHLHSLPSKKHHPIRHFLL